jgi:hypothetical protein
MAVIGKAQFEIAEVFAVLFEIKTANDPVDRQHAGVTPRR